MADRKPMIQKFTDHILLTNQHVHFRAFRTHVSQGFTCLIFDLTSARHPLPSISDESWIRHCYYWWLIQLPYWFKVTCCPKFWGLHPHVKKIFFVVHLSHGRKVTWLYSIESSLLEVILSNQSLLLDFHYFSPERETFVDVVSIMFTISRCSYFNPCTSVSNTLIILLTELGGDADYTTSQVDLSAYSDWCDGTVNIMLSYRQETRTRTWKREPVMSYCARRDMRKQMTHGLNDVFELQRDKHFQMNIVLVHFNLTPNSTDD